VTPKHVHCTRNRLFPVPPEREVGCKLQTANYGLISQERLKKEVKLLLSAKSYVASIGTTTDDLQWPWMAVLASRAISAVAELLIKVPCILSVGGAVAAGLEWTVRTERSPVLDAATRGTSTRRCWPPCQSNGRWPCCRLHGPHPGIPGPGRETQGTTRRLGRIQLSQSHCTL